MNNNKKKQAQIVRKYKGLVLASARYMKGPDYGLDDFLNQGRLIYILDEVESGETSLLEDGYIFLKEYYGFDRLFEILDWPLHDATNSKDLAQSLWEITDKKPPTREQVQKKYKSVIMAYDSKNKKYYVDDILDHAELVSIIKKNLAGTVFCTKECVEIFVYYYGVNTFFDLLINAPDIPLGTTNECQKYFFNLIEEAKNNPST